MYNIIPLIAILISLAVIIAILTKKFPVLANLDIENIQSEKEAKIKEDIISNRLKRNFIKLSSRFVIFFKLLKEKISDFFNWSYKRLNDLKENYQEADPGRQSGEVKENEIEYKFNKAETLLKEEKLSEAEKEIIEIIAADSRSLKAFQILGNIYLKQKNYNEARQTYKHALKLIKEDSSPGSEAELYFLLSLAEKGLGDFNKSIEALSKALTIEPNNPRYLDTMIELSIIAKSKQTGESAYYKLKKINPENKKLPELKKQIEDL